MLGTKDLFKRIYDSLTIYALATAPGKAGVGIIRISGPDSLPTLKRLIKYEDITKRVDLKPRLMIKANFYDQQQALLDKGMFAFFPKPASFTGEDVVELFIHSSVSVISGFYKTLDHLHLNLAKPGEFIQRSWENGKLDLLQVEAVADLLESETEEQRKFALGQMGKTKLYEWKRQLIDILAMNEAGIDFEEDDSNISQTKILGAIRELKKSIANELDGRYGEIVKNGLKVAICGPPNSGKSSLYNVLMNQNSAIVSPFPGTTRDVLRGQINLKGHFVVISDTAGIREDTCDPIELEGISRAKNEIEQADLIINLSSFDTPQLSLRSMQNKPVINVNNKSDIESGKLGNHLFISCLTGEGMDQLIDQILINLDLFRGREAPIITRERHRIHLEACVENLKLAEFKEDVEIRAEYLRMAIKDLGRIVGSVDNEHILNAVFSNFCIGK
jgi:tRNA modification GTPase